MIYVKMPDGKEMIAEKVYGSNAVVFVPIEVLKLFKKYRNKYS